MAELYRFAEYELHVQSRRLLVAGAPAQIGSRAFDVLHVLVQHRERPVPKDELLDRVWPGLDVEEGNLPVQISALRKLLGPHAIATVPGRGYRFALAMGGDGATHATAPAAAVSKLPSPPLSDGLPVPDTALIGRDDELADLLTELDQGHRLLSLVGASGIGKTRLALAMAQARTGHFRDGVSWVDLHEVADPHLVVARTGSATGVAVERAPEPLEALARGLRGRELLLVLDNCEHLIDPVAMLVDALLKGAPDVRCLITSQEPLKLPGEQVLRLDTLKVPPRGTPLDAALGFGALALLVDRARAADRRFALDENTLAPAIEICRQLDGIALAIQMAAARLPWMGVAGVQARLDDRLRLLSSGVRHASARHRTLNAALEWSHGLMSASEQIVFRRLAVFQGGFTLDGVAAVAADAHVIDRWDAIDALGALVDKSLVHVDGDRNAPVLRYRLLETNRLFALAQLDDAGEAAATRLRHAEEFGRLARDAVPRLWTQSDGDWLAGLEPEADNLRLALGTAVDAGMASLAADLYETLSWMGTLLAGGLEMRRWAVRIEPLLDGAPPPLAARLLLMLGANLRNRSPAQSVALYRRAQDMLAAAGTRDDVLQYKLHCAIAIMLARTGDSLGAAASLSRARTLLDPAWPPRLRLLEADAAGFVAMAQDDARASQVEFQRFHALAMEAGAESGVATVSHNLADLALQLGDAAEAVRMGRALVAQLRRQRNGYMLAFALGNLCAALVQAGELPEACAAGREALQQLRREDNAVWLFDHFALLARRLGQPEMAARLIGHVDAARAHGDLTRDRTEIQARAQAGQGLDAELGADRLAQLRSEGARLTDAQADGLVLRLQSGT